MSFCILYGMGYDLCFTGSVSVNCTLCSIRFVTFDISENISWYSFNIYRISACCSVFSSGFIITSLAVSFCFKLYSGSVSASLTATGSSVSSSSSTHATDAAWFISWFSLAIPLVIPVFLYLHCVERPFAYFHDENIASACWCDTFSLCLDWFQSYNQFLRQYLQLCMDRARPKSTCLLCGQQTNTLSLTWSFLCLVLRL